MSTQNTQTDAAPTDTTNYPFNVTTHNNASSLASAADINDHTATRLFNVAARNTISSQDIIVELDTEQGHWLINKLTGVSTNAVLARAQANGPDGILVQNGAPASKVSYAIGQMNRARTKHDETDEDKYDRLAHQYYHAAHSRIRLPHINPDDDLAETVSFGVKPTGKQNDIGEWLPKQHITAIHTIEPDAQHSDCFLVSKHNDTLRAARGIQDNADIFIGNECNPYTGTTTDGEPYAQRKVEIDSSPDHRDIMRALYDATYTTYNDNLKRWRATFNDIEQIIDHLAMHNLTVGIHPVTVKAASTDFNTTLSNIYHNNGGKPTSEATKYETTQTQSASSEPNPAESTVLDGLPKIDDVATDSDTEDTTTDTESNSNIEDEFKDLLN